MLIFILAAVSREAAIAIDLGSALVKSAFTKGTSSPYVAVSPPGKAVTPAFIAFRAKPSFNASLPHSLTEDDVYLVQPEIGDKAVAAANLRPRMSAGYFTRLAGLTESAAKSFSSTLFIPPVAARATFPDLAAIYLQAYLDSVANCTAIDDVRLVFPAHFTAMQRAVFWGALDAINVTRHSELDEVDAIAFRYLAEGIPVPRTVLFVDVGATSVKSYVIRFEARDRATRLSYVVDENAGGDYLTITLVELVRRRANVGETTLAEDRRLLAAAEKIKIGLSEAETIDVIASDIGGIDRPVTVTRSDLEGYARDGLAEAVVRTAKKASEGLKVDNVEAIGGSSAVPIVMEGLRQEFRGITINWTLEPLAAIALGAAHSFGRRKAVIRDRAQLYQVAVTLDGETFEMCRPGEECKTELSVPGISSQMVLKYSPHSLMGNLAALSQEFRISRNRYGNVTLKFQSRPFRFSALDKCNESCVPGRFVLEDGPEFDPLLLRLFRSPQARVLRVAELRAEVEELSLRVLDEVAKNVSVRAFTNHSQRLDIIRCAERHKNWIRLQGVSNLSHSKNFTAHLTELKKCIMPVYRRISENATLWRNANKLFEKMERAKDQLKSWKAEVDPEDSADVFQFDQRVHRLEKWFNETLVTIAGADRARDSPIRPRAFLDKYTELVYDLQKLKMKYGSGQLPIARRPDGSLPSEKDIRSLKAMPFMQKLKPFEWDEDSDNDDEDL
jgi:hypothetical protein